MTHLATQKNTKIKSVRARQLIDCKCRPLVEVDIVTEGGALGRGEAPTGSSVGMYESFVLRDENPAEYHGLSVHRAVANVNEKIAPALIGLDVTDQRSVDQAMIALDGTENKHALGGNAIYAASVACLRAAAAAQGQPVYEYLADPDAYASLTGKAPSADAQNPLATVPVPSCNVMNGGNNDGVRQAFNEFLVLPYKASDIEEGVELVVDVFHELGRVIADYTKAAPKVGGSFGWSAPSEDPAECLDLLMEAMERVGARDKCALALDCAASEMYDAAAGTYYLNGQQVTSAELVSYVKALTARYPFVFIEDMLDENDWDGFALAHREIDRTYLISDDFTVTNRERIERAMREECIDGFILKPNQVGTITEALEAHEYAREHGLFSITSGRSGGVVGDIVMDLAVGLGIPFIKNGCPRSGERIDKLNFLLRVKDLHEGCHMAKIKDLVRF